MGHVIKMRQETDSIVETSKQYFSKSLINPKQFWYNQDSTPTAMCPRVVLYSASYIAAPLLKSKQNGTGGRFHGFFLQCYFHIYPFGFYLRVLRPSPKRALGLFTWPLPITPPKEQDVAVSLPGPSGICICTFLPQTGRHSKEGQPTLVATLHAHSQR